MVQIKAHLEVKKPLGNILSAMVRDHLLAKQGSGKAVRYQARNDALATQKELLWTH